MASEIIRNANIFTMDDQGTIINQGDVLIQDGIIAAVDEHIDTDDHEKHVITDGSGMWLMPGFVQPHIHLCQTIFRGLAEDLTLLDWLRERIWPMEAAHDPDSLRASVRLGIHELFASGTTTIMDMGTVHHTEVIFEEAAKLGIRAGIGKAMMEMGKGMPNGLKETGEESLAESVRLAEKYNGYNEGRLSYVFSPRFLLSVGEDLFRQIAIEARRLDCRMQTHTSENPEESLAVVDRTGLDSLKFLENTGFMGDDVVLAHVIHLTAGEFNILKSSGSHVAHCPGSNAKLGSGIAKTPEMLDSGINVALAADGTPCNNNLSVFKEMRLAGYMQSLRQRPGTLDAKQIVYMATRGGAAAMGLTDSIGSIEPGKNADLVLMNPNMVHCSGPFSDPYTRIVYSMDERNVNTVWVQGDRVFHKGKVRGMGDAALLAEVERELEKLLQRLTENV